VRFLKWAHQRAELLLSSIILLVMVTLAFINVVTRYVVNYSFAFTEELTVYLFVWMTLLGTSIAFRDNSHMRVTLFFDKLPPALKRLVYYAIHFSCIWFFGMLTYYGSVQVLDEIAIGIGTESMHVPMAFFTSAVPLGSFLIILRIIGRMIADKRDKLIG
jgi:TRAP-type C4-dicarboxylate transport system permease small subunit